MTIRTIPFISVTFLWLTLQISWNIGETLLPVPQQQSCNTFRNSCSKQVAHALAFRCLGSIRFPSAQHACAFTFIPTAIPIPGSISTVPEMTPRLWNGIGKETTGSYQRLDLFNKFLRILCLNLTDDSWNATLLWDESYGWCCRRLGTFRLADASARYSWFNFSYNNP